MKLAVGGRAWFCAPVRPATMVRAFAGPETWVPVLAVPFTAAEQGPPPLWAPNSSREKERFGQCDECILNTNNEPDIVISIGDTGEHHRPNPQAYCMEEKDTEQTLTNASLHIYSKQQ